jgi:hypothetical protein
VQGQTGGAAAASEERFPSAGMGVVFQIQESSRYLHQQFVEVINGIGNKRGEVRFDPADPLHAARVLGREIFKRHHSDYNIDAVRPNSVWPDARDSDHDSAVTPYADV